MKGALHSSSRSSAVIIDGGCHCAQNNSPPSPNALLEAIEYVLAVVLEVDIEFQDSTVCLPTTARK